MVNVASEGKSRMRSISRKLYKSRMLYLLFTPVLMYFLVFRYLPMFGLVIAFQDYSISKGIPGSVFVGLKHFREFFSSEYTWRIVRNTLMINVYGILFGFPAPIILALMFNEVRRPGFKRITQSISYLPHFISTVVTVAIFMKFVSYGDGVVNNLIEALGGERIFFLSKPQYFRSLYTAMGIWKGIGWGTIIYLAALAGVDQELYEACYMDGGGRFRQMWHITLPGISNTIAILLILNLGGMLEVGFESILLMYNPKLYETADVISTYVYRRGVLSNEYSFSTAVGLLQSVIGLILITISNSLSKKFSEISLW